MDGYGKRILVVDDDPDVREIISVMLGETGYNVYDACDGLDALESLKKRRYDALVTDYHMPKMDGLELLDLVQAMWPELPVIIVSSDSFLRAEGKSLLASAYALLDKPFDRTELLEIVQSAVCGLPRGSHYHGRQRVSLPSQAVA